MGTLLRYPSLLVIALLAGCGSAPVDEAATDEPRLAGTVAAPLADPWAVSESIVVAQYDMMSGFAFGHPVVDCDGSYDHGYPIMRTAPVPPGATALLVEVRYGPLTTGFEVSYSIDGGEPTSLGAYNHVDSYGEQVANGYPPYPIQEHWFEIQVEGKNESGKARWEFLVQHHLLQDGCYDGGSFGDASVFVYATRSGHGHDCDDPCGALKSRLPAGVP